MAFEVLPLPYPVDALAPHIGAETVEIHYEKHHKGYLEKLEALTRGKPAADAPLEDLIQTEQGEVFDNAAQVWNHNFYWMSMKPGGGGKPVAELLGLLERSFGSFDALRREFAEAANGEFGSGWAWLVKDASGRLAVRKSSDAENPLQRGLEPLVTIDVWEHAYYLDYRNERARYVEAFLDHLINWDFVAANLALEPLGGKVHGEGNPEADRRYREAATAFAGSKRVGPAAREAARSESGEDGPRRR